MARKVFVIGMGPGGFGQLTLDAVDAMNSVDAFLVADAADDQPDLVWRRSELIRRNVQRAHRIITVLDPAHIHPEDGDLDAARLATYSQIMSGLPEEASVGFLAWGDPALYDSILRVVDALRATMTLDVTVIPGVSAPQVLAAAHEIALNRAGQSVHLTTGRRLLGEYRPDLGDVVVLNDADFTCRALVDEFPDTELYWGAYLGTADQVLANGPLRTVVPELERLRAKLIDHHGWIQDIYLLRPAP
ncbi:precorrin-6A synthase (deacetylating) [Tessaracoccus aquimaris]|uniref:Precorrin-6A synthase (Deacetylating) n=1 Tax=Tessaracoccus aquimaris TaxID=1332264 RepID=A0A1Q2CLE2_9ACTN|nr:precorrin-6A synthase (deacetylating) [Tessaracoccus aquimaris]AQP46934.1 precorrin-6A synthase (deacetylating) [Tessaracoccus aquimaris]